MPKYSFLKTVLKSLLAAGAGYVSLVAPDLLNTLIVFLSDPTTQAGLLAPIPPAYKPVVSLFILGFLAGLKNWASNKSR